MGGKLKAWVVTWIMGGAINNMQQNKIKIIINSTVSKE